MARAAGKARVARKFLFLPAHQTRPFRVGLALQLLGDSDKNRAIIKQGLDFVVNFGFITNDCGDFSVSEGGFEDCHCIPFD
jgi:hypothetical protein